MFGFWDNRVCHLSVFGALLNVWWMGVYNAKCSG